MATALPSFLAHSFTPFDTSSFYNNNNNTIVTKNEKITGEDDDEFKWFNEQYCSVNNQPTMVNNSNVSSVPSSVNSAAPNISANFPLQTLQFNNITLAGSSNAPIQGPSTSVFTPIMHAVSNPNANHQSMNAVPTIYSFQGAYPGMYSILSNGQLVSIPQSLGIPTSQASQQSQNATTTPQPIVLTNFSFPQQQQPLALTPQYYQLLAQLQNQKPAAPPADDAEDRKRSRTARPSSRRVRHTRPKVIEAKGAIQCKGRNRKKGTQCRNAALMEYIGPKPIYCAEHIELDPNSLYEKCKSPYQKEPGDKKGCKEVVLKEFGLCYKHYGDAVADLVRLRDVDNIRKQYERITELLDQLEKEAAAAKKKDGDLYQRKNKLIPKFQEMKKHITKACDDLRIAKHTITHHTSNYAMTPTEISADDIGSPFGSSPISTHDSLSLSDDEGDCNSLSSSSSSTAQHSPIEHPLFVDQLS